MFKGEQRGTYLAEQSVYVVASGDGAGAWILIAKVKLEDVAGMVATPDASPPAAVSTVP